MACALSPYGRSSSLPLEFPRRRHRRKIGFDLGSTAATPEAIRAMVEELAKKRDR
ncbi:MAG: hypothetical protein MUE49_15145 [Rhodospirillales bacterium]|nr:hypothetical protein [Rhodospirillales bacterium]